MHFRFLPLALLAAVPAFAQPRAGLDASASVMRFAEHGYGSRTYGTLEAGVPVRLGARTTLAPGVLWQTANAVIRHTLVSLDEPPIEPWYGNSRIEPNNLRAAGVRAQHRLASDGGGVQPFVSGRVYIGSASSSDGAVALFGGGLGVAFPVTARLAVQVEGHTGTRTDFKPLFFGGGLTFRYGVR